MIISTQWLNAHRHPAGLRIGRLRIGLLGTVLLGCLWLAGDAVAAELMFERVLVQRVLVPGVAQQPVVSPAQHLDQWATASVIYLGETHDSALDHTAQLDILTALHQRQPRLIIALEMFQRPAQPLLNAYLADRLTETELQTRSEYQKRWGFPWEFYAPILRFAKTNQLPVVALNAPSEVTRKVARQGLASLTWSERRFIPPVGAIALGPAAYRQRLQTIYESFHQNKTNSQSRDRFFQAQVLWDETMAEHIAATAKRYPDHLIVVLVGQGHLLYGDGIPDRVRRRHPAIKQTTVLLNPSAELQQESSAAAAGGTADSRCAAIADYFWISPPK